MGAIPWPQIDTASAVIFGLLGLAVAWLSYRAGVRSHASQLRIEARTIADAAKHTLDDIAEEPVELFKAYRGVHAAQGMLYSGATEEKRIEFEEAGAAIAGLQAELTDAALGIGKLSGRKLEDRLVLLRSINACAGSLRDKFAEHHDNLRRQREAIMNQIQAKWAKPGAGTSDLVLRT
jgi:hypothetical protein